MPLLVLSVSGTGPGTLVGILLRRLFVPLEPLFHYLCPLGYWMLPVTSSSVPVLPRLRRFLPLLLWSAYRG